MFAAVIEMNVFNIVDIISVSILIIDLFSERFKSEAIA